MDCQPIDKHSLIKLQYFDDSSDEWVGVDRLMKYTEENIMKQQALDEKLLVNGIKWLLNSKSGCSTNPEVLNGAKGKKKERDSSVEVDDDRPRPDLIDFISQMPNDVLVKILSRVPLKHAVTTSILSTRWRFVWSYLKNLSFDGTKTLAKMNEKLFVLERGKYINQVNSVIRSHGSPTLQLFQICFDLDQTCSKDIDNWLWFVLDKKTERLELNLIENRCIARDTKDNYDFPLPLSDGNVVRLSEWPSSTSMVVETLSLKKVSLLRVNVSELALNGLLKNSPQLETLYIYGSGLLTDVNVGGRNISLKHFVIMGCPELHSISLHDFDLEKFHYIGQDIEICLSNLPKIKELDIGQVSVGLNNNNVFSSISSVSSHLEVLSLDIDRSLVSQEDLRVNVVPVLPNVKTLKLTLPSEHHDSLLEFIEIAKACPNLETLIISLYWCSPNTRAKDWQEAVGHYFPRLKRLEIHGYRGLINDFQIAMYMIGNAAGSLKKIVIDSSCHPYDEDVLTAKELMKRGNAGRSHAESELSKCMPPWVELAIL